MKARIVRLGKLGKRLEGPAIGKLLAEFLNNCRREGVVAIIDCYGVERLGDAVARNMAKFTKEMPEVYVTDACKEVIETLTRFCPHTFSRRPS